VIRLLIDPSAPAASLLERAAEAIRRGELVVMPTDTLYGLAADPFNAEAVRRLCQVKGRPAGRPLPLIGADRTQVVGQLGALSPSASRLAEAFWPGPLTLIVPAPATLGRGVTGGTETVGVRVPDHAVARGVCRAAGSLLTATSANPSGQPASADPDEAVRVIENAVAVLLDAGRTAGGPPSTIVDVTSATARLVRAGAVAWEEVERCVRAG
jgi:L-threonylcarbamoyladenylate synthase